jgi:hypothetical protein
MDISGIARGGLPSFYTDGSLIDWSRSDSNAAVGPIQIGQQRIFCRC